MLTSYFFEPTRGCAVPFAEDAVEIALVFIADGYGDLLHREGSIFQEECRLRESFLLQMLGVGLARTVLDLVAEPIKIIVQQSCRLSKAAVLVILLNIAQDVHYGLILATLVRKLVGVV